MEMSVNISPIESPNGELIGTLKFGDKKLNSEMVLLRNENSKLRR